MNRKYKLSICITVKDRSKVYIEHQKYLELFPNCMASLAAAIHKDDEIEIVISDWQSKDWPLDEWVIDTYSELDIKIRTVQGAFHRGAGRNIAAEHALSDNLLFLDADMLVPRSMLLKGMEYLKQQTAYFPTCFYYLDEHHSKGFWCFGGRGICFLTKDMFLKAGGWPQPPSYVSHVDEDQFFFKKLERNNIFCKIEREDDLFHQYHPGRSVDLIYRKQRHLIENAK